MYVHTTTSRILAETCGEKQWYAANSERGTSGASLLLHFAQSRSNSSLSMSVLWQWVNKLPQQCAQQSLVIDVRAPADPTINATIARYVFGHVDMMATGRSRSKADAGTGTHPTVIRSIYVTRI